MGVLMADTSTGPTPEAPSVKAPADRDARVFSMSLLISGVRCVLSYLVFPFLLPLVGLSGAVGPGLGLAVSLVAIVANGWSVARFWRADHRLKWLVTVVSAGVIGMMLFLMIGDIRALLG